MTRPFAIGFLIVCGASLPFMPSATVGAELEESNFNDRVNLLLKPTTKLPGVIRSDVGVTRRGTSMPCLITKEDLNYFTPKTRVLLVGGLDGSAATVEATLMLMTHFVTSEKATSLRTNFAFSAVPVTNPDGWASGKGPGNLSGGNPSVGYPPKGSSYNSPADPEAAYLWRWIGTHAPDLVIVISPKMKGSEPTESSDSLATQLNHAAPANVGIVPALTAEVGGSDEITIQNVMNQIRIHQTATRSNSQGTLSPARLEMQRRLQRSPLDITRQLSKRYGHQLNSVAYIPALALVGRIRLGQLTDDAAQLEEVEKIVRPYFEGSKPSLPNRASGSNLSGHLVFGELAKATEKKRYVELVQVAANVGFDEKGQPKASMPYHSEMSDAVFMGCPILVQAGKLTGEKKYFEMALRHMRFMTKLNVRNDGLHRHSPLDEAAWGRGNGFPALGLALSLTDMPEDYLGREEMLATFQSHLAALAKHQDPTGAWHQVIDHPESYRELSSTCMITFSMIRGVRNGWLDENEYKPVVARAWQAIRTRVAPNATLIDVCTGTGKQKSLRDYYDRPAILGFDDRGGAMTLMVATELASDEW